MNKLSISSFLSIINFYIPSKFKPLAYCKSDFQTINRFNDYNEKYDLCLNVYKRDFELSILIKLDIKKCIEFNESRTFLSALSIIIRRFKLVLFLNNYFILRLITYTSIKNFKLIQILQISPNKE